MALKLGKWTIGKSSAGTALDKARSKVIDDLRQEQRHLRGEGAGSTPQAEIGTDGIGQVKIFYRYFNLLGQGNCIMVGEVANEAALADKIDEVIELVTSGELDDSVQDALKKEKRDQMRDQKGMTNK